MKKVSLITAAIFFLAATMASAQIGHNNGSLGFGINGGLYIPAGGDVTADSSFGDYFGAGPGFGAHIQYNVIKELTIRAGFDYAFMKMDDEAKGTLTGDPYFSSPYIFFDGAYNLGNYINSGNGILNPYVLAGGEIHFWKITDDGAGGDPLPIGSEEWKNTSFGLRFGAGVEVFAMPQLSIFAEGKYHLMFTEDTEKFGEDFGNLGMIDITAGLTYYFPIGAK